MKIPRDESGVHFQPEETPPHYLLKVRQWLDNEFPSNFFEIKTLLCHDNINQNMRQRLVKCYILFDFLYATETWIIKADAVTKLEVYIEE